MADTPDNDQKTESPSAKRLTDARAKGDVLQSRELGTALAMGSGALWFVLGGPWLYTTLETLVRDGLARSARDWRDFDPAHTAIDLAGEPVLPLASLFAATLIAAIAGPALLGSLGVRAEAFAFKPSRLNPVSGLSRMFGINGVIELGKAIAKASVLGLVGYALIARDWDRIIGLARVDEETAASAIGASIGGALIWLALGLIAVAAIDVPIQFVRRTARLRMTKHEVKEEARQSDGSPELKAAQRQRQRALITGSARVAITTASVVLTNPTHFAVALRYRPGIDAVPVVAARGRGETALAIRALANEEGVPCLDYPQLTRALYFTTRSGQPIAPDLYAAVATILAFIFALDRSAAASASPPPVDVPPAKRFDASGKVS